MRILICLASIFLLVKSPHAAAQTANIIETYKDWRVYTAEVDAKKICFAASGPKVVLPKKVNRGKILFYVSIWNGESGVRNEISIKIGYPFKAGSTPTVEVGTEKINMFVENDRAFVEKAEDEQRLVAAMRKGNVLVVNGVSKRGTQTLDRYSLTGISKALDRISKECP